MTWTHSPMTFWEALASTPNHFIILGGSYACLVFGWLLVATFRNGLSIREALPSTWKLALFMILLLGFGVIAEVFWSTCVRGHLYHSTDNLVSYVPFIPVTHHGLDLKFTGQHGALQRVNLMQINLIWIAISAIVWGATVVSYRHLRPFRSTERAQLEANQAHPN